MHSWGDESVDWNGINAAASYIGEGLKKWGRVSVQQYKEKFGTVRVYCYLGLNWWPQLHRPGAIRSNWPKWMWKYNTSPRWLFRLLNKFVIPYHCWLYRRYYKKAIEKWPHLEKEILCGATYTKLLKGLGE